MLPNSLRSLSLTSFFASLAISAGVNILPSLPALSQTKPLSVQSTFSALTSEPRALRTSGSIYQPLDGRVVDTDSYERCPVPPSKMEVITNISTIHFSSRNADIVTDQSESTMRLIDRINQRANVGDLIIDNSYLPHLNSIYESSKRLSAMSSAYSKVAQTNPSSYYSFDGFGSMQGYDSQVSGSVSNPSTLMFAELNKVYEGCRQLYLATEKEGVDSDTSRKLREFLEPISKNIQFSATALGVITPPNYTLSSFSTNRSAVDSVQLFPVIEIGTRFMTEYECNYILSIIDSNVKALKESMEFTKGDLKRLKSQNPNMNPDIEEYYLDLIIQRKAQIDAFSVYIKFIYAYKKFLKENNVDDTPENFSLYSIGFKHPLKDIYSDKAKGMFIEETQTGSIIFRLDNEASFASGDKSVFIPVTEFLEVQSQWLSNIGAIGRESGRAYSALLGFESRGFVPEGSFVGLGRNLQSLAAQGTDSSEHILLTALDLGKPNPGPGKREYRLPGLQF